MIRSSQGASATKSSVVFRLLCATGIVAVDGVPVAKSAPI